MKQVIVLRKDLNMRKGKMIAQGAHASIGALDYLTDFTSMGKLKLWLNAWASEGSTKIVLGVHSEDELIALHKIALGRNLPTHLVRDAAKTEFKEPTFTAVAIGPAPDELIDKITGDLKLL